MKKEREQLKVENEQKETYLKTTLEEFLLDIKEKFGKFDLSNMEKNASKIQFDVETKIQNPVTYVAEANYIILGSKLDNRYTESERKHAIYHELVHMSTTKKAGSTNSKTGFGFVLGMAISKRVAITEGITEYITEKITGNEIDIAYLFEKRCSKSLHEIFGDDLIQNFFNADEKNLYKHVEKYGIFKKELKELFNDMDKSLMWRNNSLVDLRKNKKIKNNNQYISNIEEKLVNITARVCLEKGISKEETLEKIDKVTQCFITPNLNFNIEEPREEAFLSEHSGNLDKPFEYAEKIKEDILLGKIVSSSQLITSKNSLLDKLVNKLKIKNSVESVLLPESIKENGLSEKTTENFLNELESMKNTDNIGIENKEIKKQIDYEEKII